MTKSEFINKLNSFNRENNHAAAVSFMHNVTRLSNESCNSIINPLWHTSKFNYFGKNIYDLIYYSAEEINDLNPIKKWFEPILKPGSTVYYNYLDLHTAFFALAKIKQYKLEKKVKVKLNKNNLN